MALPYHGPPHRTCWETSTTLLIVLTAHYTPKICRTKEGPSDSPRGNDLMCRVLSNPTVAREGFKLQIAVVLRASTGCRSTSICVSQGNPFPPTTQSSSRAAGTPRHPADPIATAVSRLRDLCCVGPGRARFVFSCSLHIADNYSDRRFQRETPLL